MTAMHYHTGLAYETTDEFLEGALPFVAKGVSQDFVVMAVTSGEKADALRRSGGDIARSLIFAPADDWYTSQARVFSKFIERARALHEDGRRELCVLTDPSVAGFGEEQIRRWVYTENAVNLVLREMPLSVMCAYDLRGAGLTREQIEISHPHMAAGHNVCCSSRFVEPSNFNGSAHAVTCSDAPADATSYAFDGHTLTELRSFVHEAARTLGLDAARRSDLVMAASEAAGNAVEHGGGHGVARMWRDGGEVVCAIENPRGHIRNAAAGFVTPGWASERGRGIWMMRQLCDWVDLRPAGAGTSVRLHMRA